jgi:glycosyltransferase involved in cell wall biosynthesis
MKILYIITQADDGGAQKYVLTLAKHFRGAIAAGTEASNLFKHAQEAGVPTFSLKFLKRSVNPLYDFLACWEIRQLVKTYKPDIVHLNSSKAGILGSFACMGMKTKVIFTAHGFIFNEPLPHFLKTFYLALEKTASSYRDFIITVSEADKLSALNNSLIIPEKIKTIYNGISKINFLPKEQAQLKLQIPNNKLIIGLVSNLYKTKGLDILIESINQLEKTLLSNVLVYIIGQGPQESNLKTQISSLKLNNKIFLTGKVTNAATYLKAFDIFVLPSRKEGFPYSLLEAMQAGLPIITTNTGGNAEAVGTAALLVKPQNPIELTEAIKKLVTSREHRLQLTQAVQLRNNLFTEEKMLLETQDTYKKILP